jgi:ANTAR domain
MIRFDAAGADASSPNDTAAVERAKGVLMESFGVSADQADEAIRAWSGLCECPVDRVARVFVDQIWNGNDDCCDRAVARALEDAVRDLPQIVAQSASTRMVSSDESAASGISSPAARPVRM